MSWITTPLCFTVTRGVGDELFEHASDGGFAQSAMGGGGDGGHREVEELAAADTELDEVFAFHGGLRRL
ncbi:MAG: hypothetical protein HC841_08435 [Verrucomicrobiae bacterium]|nr:hypothetical protein [Verrucomicrobiae bacterium]